jgi:hypothetical protein
MHMGLEVNRGSAQYNEPVSTINLRSLSAKRAALIKWHHQHPHSFRLFTKADALVSQNYAKLRSYNETLQRLEKRIGESGNVGSALPLVASLTRVSNLKGILEKNISAQSKERNMLASRISDWRETLPQLDEQIAQGKLQRAR